MGAVDGCIRINDLTHHRPVFLNSKNLYPGNHVDRYERLRRLKYPAALLRTIYAAFDGLDVTYRGLRLSAASPLLNRWKYSSTSSLYNHSKTAATVATPTTML